MPVAVHNAWGKHKTVLTRVELEALEGETVGCTADDVSKDDCISISQPMHSFAKVTFPFTIKRWSLFPLPLNPREPQDLFSSREYKE